MIHQIGARASSRFPLSTRRPLRSFLSCRAFATHRDHPTTSSFLSDQLDRAASRGSSSASTSSSYDSVGPFSLGLRSGQVGQAEPKRWSKLSAGEKVIRGTARTTNLTVILLGGAFSCVLAYALATELFAKNSPTALYADACDRVQASSEVARHLKAPLTFHTNAPSPLAPRHRNRHVSSQLAVDSGGKEHLLLHFWVEAKPSHLSDNIPPSQFSDVTVASAYSWSVEKATSLLEDSKKAFAYVVGSPVPTQNAIPHPSSRSPSNDLLVESGSSKPTSGSSKGWGLAGLFSGLRGRQSSRDKSDSDFEIEWTGGEVHADLVKDEKGDFNYRYLFVDIPYSRAQKSLRVYVQKGPGFREGEGVFVWG